MPAVTAERLCGLMKSYAHRCANTALHQSALWTERYKPLQSTDICGNRDAVVHFMCWLRESRRIWQLGRRLGADSEGDTSDEDETYRTMVLTGPEGVGKTSMVHACASELGFNIIEVNASQDRSGAKVMQMFREATLSRSVGVEWTSQVKGAVPKKKRRKKKDRDAVDKSSTTSAPLILFDEADLLLEEDRGFFGAMAKMMAAAKCPIVVTCNRLTGSHKELTKINGVEHRALDRPDVASLLLHVKAICAVEGIEIGAGVDLVDLISSLDNDMRKVLNTLQFDLADAATEPSASGRRFASSLDTPLSRSQLKTTLLAPAVTRAGPDWLSSTVEKSSQLLTERYLDLMSDPHLSLDSLTEDSRKQADCAVLEAMANCADGFAVADVIGTAHSNVWSDEESYQGWHSEYPGSKLQHSSAMIALSYQVGIHAVQAAASVGYCAQPCKASVCLLDSERRAQAAKGQLQMGHWRASVAPHFRLTKSLLSLDFQPYFEMTHRVVTDPNQLGSGGRSRRNCVRQARCLGEEFGLTEELMALLSAGPLWSGMESAAQFSTDLYGDDLGYQPSKRKACVIDSSSDDELGDS